MHLFRQTCLTILIIACLFATTPAADYFTPKDAPQPNIIIIMSDDMGISDIGCYGSEIKTPVLDTLAKDGVRFKQFYNTGRCCPTRAALLTGLYSHQAGIGHMMNDRGSDGYRGELAPTCVTIAEALKPAGYSTYMIGKWHVTKNVHDTGDVHNWPLQRGFDKFYGMVSGAGSFFDPKSLARGNKNISPENDEKYKPKTYYFTDAISDNAVAFFKEHQQEEKKSGKKKPFFAYVAYTAAHWPMHALPEDIAKYKGDYDQGWDKISKTRLAKMIELGLIDKAWTTAPRDPSAPAWDSQNDRQKKVQASRMEVYAAMVDRMDQGIGKIVEELKRQGKFENTLILFLQDNGACAEKFGLQAGIHPPLDTKERRPAMAKDALQFDMAPKWTRDGRPVHRGADLDLSLGTDNTYIGYGLPWANASNTPFRRYKHWEHEGGISSPLIVSWPAFFKKSDTKTGGWVAGPGHLIDLMATSLDVAGAKYPEKRKDAKVTPCEGESLIPMLLGKKRDDEILYWEHEGNRAVRKGDWKLVSAGRGAWELYEMTKDRCEMHDLAKEMPEKVKELDKLWQAWAKRAQVIPNKPAAKKKKK